MMTASTDQKPGDKPLQGIVLVIIGMAVLVMMDAHAKYLGQTFPILMVLWARYFFNLVLVVALYPRQVPGLWRAPYKRLQITRALLAMTTAGLVFLALKTMALADMIALAFLSPIFVTILAGPLLQEKVGLRRWIAVIVGFIGMLIIIRPGLTVFQPASLLVIAATVIFALFLIMTRKLARLTSTANTALFQALVGTVILSIALPFVWQTPAWPTQGLWSVQGLDMLLLVTIGLCGGVGQVLLVYGYERAPAATLAPFSYIELIWAILIGYLVFGDVPDLWVLLGAGVIIGCGLYIAHRERL